MRGAYKSMGTRTALSTFRKFTIFYSLIAIGWLDNQHATNRPKGRATNGLLGVDRVAIVEPWHRWNSCGHTATNQDQASCSNGHILTPVGDQNLDDKVALVVRQAGMHSTGLGSPRQGNRVTQSGGMQQGGKDEQNAGSHAFQVLRWCPTRAWQSSSSNAPSSRWVHTSKSRINHATPHANAIFG